MTFTVKGSSGTKPSVHFRCEACRAKLNAPLTDAGKTELCPTCRMMIRVPGADDLQAWRQRQANAAKEAAEKAARVAALAQTTAQEAADNATDASTSAPQQRKRILVPAFCGIAACAIAVAVTFLSGIWEDANESALDAAHAHSAKSAPPKPVATMPAAAIEVTSTVPAVTVTFDDKPKDVIESAFAHVAPVGNDLMVFVSLVEVRPTQTGMSASELRDLFDGNYVPSGPAPWITVVNVAVSNKSKTRKFDFTSWRGLASSSYHASISDNFGNDYEVLPQWKFPASLKGEVAIYPGETVIDQIILERLVNGVESLTLHLPCKNLGAQGEIQVEVDAKDIKWYGRGESTPP